MSGLSVLVADDDPDMLDTLRTLLARSGVGTIIAAESAAGAFAALSKPDPLHLMICDLRLGADEGIEVLRECRRVRPFVQRVLVTGHSEDGWRASGVRPDDAHMVLEKDALLRMWPKIEALLRQAQESLA